MWFAACNAGGLGFEFSSGFSAGDGPEAPLNERAFGPVPAGAA